MSGIFVFELVLFLDISFVRIDHPLLRADLVPEVTHAFQGESCDFQLSLPRGRLLLKLLQ